MKFGIRCPLQGRIKDRKYTVDRIMENEDYVNIFARTGNLKWPVCR